MMISPDPCVRILRNDRMPYTTLIIELAISKVRQTLKVN